VVDDNADNRMLLAELVAVLGHRGTPAGNGREALVLLSERPFDLVLLDVLMPQMDGFAALERIKGDARLRELPVIMVSGLGEVDGVVRCIEAGAEDYLTKPFDPVLLRARINACLEKKRLRDAERLRAAELEAALARLEAAQQQLVTQAKLASLGTLTAGIAHEIRNPLNFVTNFAEVVVEQVGELRHLLGGADGASAELLADLERNVAKIREHGRRADQIVRGMLLHARGQAGERQRTDLNALVEEVVAGARTNPELVRGVKVKAKLDAKLDPFPFDAEMLRQVAWNFVLNALQALEGKGTLTVETGREPGFAVLRVIDTGPGISADPAEIFKPFFTTKRQGTGLGLAIADRIVKAHGGRIELESKPGKGAAFTVRLPHSESQ